jgi:hypothetical protein
MIHQGPTGRLVYAAHERDGHITTSGRRALPRELYALPPGPREKRRGIKGRVPFDTHARAISGLSRLSGMHRRNPKKLTAGQLHAARKKILDYWSQIEPTI